MSAFPRWTRAGLAAGNAFQMLRLHGLRTTLATTGIIVGTMALAAVLTISDGLYKSALDELGRSSEAELQLRARATRSVDYVQVPRSEVLRFEDKDLSDLSIAFTGQAAVAMRDSGVALFEHQGRERGLTVMGLVTEGRPLVDLVRAGRAPAFGKANVSDSSAVLVNYSLARLLVGPVGPVDKVVGSSFFVGGQRVQIVGVADSASKSRGQFVIWGRPQLARTLDPRTELVIAVRPHGLPSREKFDAVNATMERWINQNRPQWRNGVRWDAPGYARIEGLTRAADRLRLALSAFSLLTVLVAGIGIANVIFASVLERTREVGIRKAVGARFADVFGQFLFESVTISTLGGLAGAGAGIAVAASIAWFIRSSTSQPMQIDPQWQTIAVSLGMAIAVGILAGVVPSIRAARMAPTDSMRVE